MILKLHIRQTAILDKSGNLIYYNGANPASLSAIVGTLPTSRQFPGYPDYQEVTSGVSDLYKLKLTWTAERNEQGEVIPTITQAKKSASGSLSFEGSAYSLVKKWLIDDVSAPLNSIDVMIEHVDVGVYYDYKFTAKDIQWCDSDSICVFDVTIKQKEQALTCIKRTLVEDNYDGWFQTIPSRGRKHPRFSYCNEQRPIGMLAMLWYIANTFAGTFFLTILPIALGINSIIAILKAVKWVVGKLGFNTSGWNIPNYIKGKDLFAPFGQFFVESAGCGREHPAPLIRDYIQNVCSKCGVTVNETTAPLFFAEQYTFEKSTGVTITKNNPYYWACYFNAPVKKGIRRFNSLMPVLPPFFNNDANDTDFYILENSPNLTLDMFLDKICPVWNSEWRVIDNTLYIRRKDYFTQTTNVQVYDFTVGSPDRFKLLSPICYEWNQIKYPAALMGLWANDAVDSCGNEAVRPMGDMISFGDSDNNPNFEGILDKTQQFGATKFRHDASSTDYIDDCLQVVANGAAISPVPSFTFTLKQASDAFNEFADYALLLSDETASLPKILIWDGQSYTNAKCVRDVSADFLNGSSEPIPNMKYNSTFYSIKNEVRKHEFVLGSRANLGSFPLGYYTVRTALGISIISQNKAMLPNYPMYFNSGFEDNLWDYFHWIDDPRLKPTLNQNWNCKINLCADDLKLLQVFNDSKDIRLGAKVKLNIPFYPDGKLTEIEVSYDPESDRGQYIGLKGTC